MQRPILVTLGMAIFTAPIMANFPPWQAPALKIEKGAPEISSTISYQQRYQGIYDVIWQKIENNYAQREKLKNWSQWRHKFDRSINSRKELIIAANQMLDSLTDDYTYLLSDHDRQEREKSIRTNNIVSHQRLTDDLGYIKLNNFTASGVVNEFQQALAQLHGCNAYILDLRNNHGGFIDNANQIFAMLADSGVFMTYTGYENGGADLAAYILHSNYWQVWHNGISQRLNRQSNAINDKPLLILVNSDTRSAAELLAGALRDNRQAIILGTQTYGKGILQNTYQLDDDLLLKVTTAKYFLPNGQNIHGTGIKPDIPVKQSLAADSQLQAALTKLQGRLRQRHYAAAWNFH